MIGRILSALLLAMLASYAMAQDTPADGSNVRDKFSIGRGSIAVPPGDWQVVGSRTANITRGGVMPIGRWSEVLLVQVDQDKTLIAAYFARATHSSVPVSNWSDRPCDVSGVIEIIGFDGNRDNPECTVISFASPANNIFSPGPIKEKMDAWLAQVSPKMPKSFVRATHVKYLSGDFIYAGILVNPEYFGQAPTQGVSFTTSEWHPNNLKTDPKRAAFIEAVKVWSKALADSTKSTLATRSPSASGLPGLEVMRVK